MASLFEESAAEYIFALVGQLATGLPKTKNVFSSDPGGD
jgi:hypothetical protein